jgi:signal transduction histidine kinase
MTVQKKLNITTITTLFVITAIVIASLIIQGKMGKRVVIQRLAEDIQRQAWEFNSDVYEANLKKDREAFEDKWIEKYRVLKEKVVQKRENLSSKNNIEALETIDKTISRIDILIEKWSDGETNPVLHNTLKRDLLKNSHLMYSQSMAIEKNIRTDNWADLTRVSYGLFLCLLIILLANLMQYFVISRNVLKPLKKLEQGVASIGAGNFDYRVDLKSNDEFGRLSNAFNKMAGELQEGQEQLIQSEKMVLLGTLSALIAHEIGNPLTVIRTAADLGLQEESKLKSSELFEKVINGVEKILRIISKIRSFSHASEHHEKTMVALDRPIEDALELLNKKFQSHGVKITKKFTEGQISLVADETQLQQVFLNMFINAVDAMKSKELTLKGHVYQKAIVIELVKHEKNIQILISDNGIGMPQDVQSKIFKTFFTTKPIGNGTGLGLTVVSNIMKQHSGAIEVISKEGQGTTMKLIFPI